MIFIIALQMVTTGLRGFAEAAKEKVERKTGAIAVLDAAHFGDARL